MKSHLLTSGWNIFRTRGHAIHFHVFFFGVVDVWFAFRDSTKRCIGRRPTLTLTHTHIQHTHNSPSSNRLVKSKNQTHQVTKSPVQYSVRHPGNVSFSERKEGVLLYVVFHRPCGATTKNTPVPLPTVFRVVPVLTGPASQVGLLLDCLRCSAGPYLSDFCVWHMAPGALNRSGVGLPGLSEGAA